jgi:hypothetical protein
MRYRTIAPLWVGVAALLVGTVPTRAQNRLAIQLPSQTHQLTADDAAVTRQSLLQSKKDEVVPETEDCSYTFASGSGATYLKFCVAVNGNIISFNSPQGVEQIAQDGAYEGYGICDVYTGNQYYDYAAYNSGNWNAPTTISRTGTSVKIERTTSDGLWTLTQAITSTPGTNPYATVGMELKNNSDTIKNVLLLRYVNAVPDKAATTGNWSENYDGTNDSAWGYTGLAESLRNGSDPYGLMIQNVGNPTPTSVSYGRVGFAINTEAGPAPCTFYANYESPIVNAQGSAVYLYSFVLAKEQSVTETLKYISF